MIKITSLFTAILIMIGTVFASILPRPAAPASQEELYSVQDTVKRKEPGDTIYAVDISRFSSDEKYAAISLQGIVAKKNPCIYLGYGSTYEFYLKEIERSTGKTIIRTDENGEKWTFKSLILQFIDYIGEYGYTLYENSEYAEGLNVATNYATAFGWLPVTPSIESEVLECGLSLKQNLTQEKYGYAFQRKHFNKLKGYFEKGTVVHEKFEKMGLRDLAIEQGYFCFYTMNDVQGNTFLRDILRWSGKNTSVYGWCEHEKETVEIVSKLGSHMNPADYCYNCSYFSQVECTEELEYKPAVVHTDKSKHYVTLVFSDGDNCQWLQNGFSEYHNTIEKYPDAKISWTFSPVLRTFCPPAYDFTAKTTTENTSFVCGPSGFGYCNPTLFDTESLELFSTETASAMLKSNERVITILDDYTALKEGRMARSFDWFSRFDNIDGGILFLDPDRYEAGKGKVWFSNEKPFVSVRVSLWATGGYDGATDEWLAEQAQKINSYPAEINSIDGYSVICVHAWTMKPESIDKFISLLDEHVEILSADDFIKTVAENVPHKTASPIG